MEYNRHYLQISFSSSKSAISVGALDCPNALLSNIVSMTSILLS